MNSSVSTNTCNATLLDSAQASRILSVDIELTLARMADDLLDYLKQLLGFMPIFKTEAVLHST